jgi:hypothetical protein
MPDIIFSLRNSTRIATNALKVFQLVIAARRELMN